jgi:DNA-binding CsgD family transcriptional regulator
MGRVRFLETFMTGTKPNRKRSRSVRPSRRSTAESVAPREPDPLLRKTGIRLVGEMPWGAHICVFYEAQEDLFDTVVAYFEAGLESNEFCVWTISEPITEEEARNALRRDIVDFDRRLAAGQIEILQGREWYLKGGQFDLKRIIGDWGEKLRGALAKGYEGMRVSSNAFWLATNHWKEFCAYEHELDRALVGEKMIVLSTYSLRASRAADILDVTRAHQFSLARRNRDWEFLEIPDLKRVKQAKQAKQEIDKLNGALAILSKPFAGHELLTPRERVALAYVVRGATSKEAGRMLGISARTVEFHRANIMKKLGAKNTVDLVRGLLSE